MTLRLALVASAAALSAACTATAPEPVCRPATNAERAVFGAIVAHNEAGVADMMAEGPEAQRLRALDPEIEAMVFGQRMSDPAVRGVLTRDLPLCLYDRALSDGSRITYVFPDGRFEALQNIELPGAELGQPLTDHAACRFVREGEAWVLADACLATFGPAPAPAS